MGKGRSEGVASYVLYFIFFSVCILFYVLFSGHARACRSFLKRWCIEFSTSPTGLILNNSRGVHSLCCEYRHTMNTHKKLSFRSPCIFSTKWITGGLETIVFGLTVVSGILPHFTEWCAWHGRAQQQTCCPRVTKKSFKPLSLVLPGRFHSLKKRCKGY